MLARVLAASRVARELLVEVEDERGDEGLVRRRALHARRRGREQAHHVDHRALHFEVLGPGRQHKRLDRLVWDVVFDGGRVGQEQVEQACRCEEVLRLGDVGQVRAEQQQLVSELLVLKSVPFREKLDQDVAVDLDRAELCEGSDSSRSELALVPESFDGDGHDLGLEAAEHRLNHILQRSDFMQLDRKLFCPAQLQEHPQHLEQNLPVL
mmetsp:Transcript_13484/g.32141  ORF Transcript_13484/g.32141 Transcript_13484/m.32141 type:complete len:210 (-) Transcript_13484:423-1052(-)